ncbi:MAG: DUF3473 domain-containing protein [Planctomycetes bacterium]|nr:DUF3473 domain-containing protein [Planctomycetota bacterium]
MIHALTIDVEDYHSILARDWLDREAPPSEAVVRKTHRLLEMLAEHDVRATFFVLGEVAQTFPHLIRDLVEAGHEVGVHGYHHRQVFKLTPEEFRAEVGGAQSLIQDITGVAAQGHRAPAFSITPQTSWALEVLAELGFRYDSSVFPIAGRRYGWPGFPLDIHEMTLDSGRKIIEAPLTTVSVFGKRFPACGGGYLRHFPYWYTRWAIRRAQRSRPAIVYLHPYELDTVPYAPDVSGLSPDARRTALRFHRGQTRNRHTVKQKLVRLLGEFRFTTVSEVIDRVLERSSPASGCREAGAPA